MSIKAKLSREVLEQSEKLKVHFIPASIDGNGPIKINEYFNPYTETEHTANELQTNALRGFPLKGIELKLPENLQGVVLRESEQLKIDGAERELKFGGKFDEFVYWNYDKNPSENDAYRKALHWIKVADAMHTEVTSLGDDPQ